MITKESWNSDLVSYIAYNADTEDSAFIMSSGEVLNSVCLTFERTRVSCSNLPVTETYRIEVIKPRNSEWWMAVWSAKCIYKLDSSSDIGVWFGNCNGRIAPSESDLSPYLFNIYYIYLLLLFHYPIYFMLSSLDFLLNPNLV